VTTEVEQAEHDESLRTLIAIETLAIAVVDDATHGLPKDPDDASDELRSRLSQSLISARTAARVQSTNRLSSEYEVVSRHARKQGYRTGSLSFFARPIAFDIEEAGKWADHIAKLVRKRASESEIRSAISRSKGKLSAAARAVVDDAWSDERNRVLRATAARQKETNIVPFVGTIWDARLDKKTCPRCWGLDGTIRPMGIDFPNGAVPGKIHALCRCNGALIFAPIITSISDKEAA
jgi:hypothetical protein